jgi:hypothetical protein
LFGQTLAQSASASGQSQSVAITESSARPAAWHWLAPAMAVFLLGMFVMGRNPSGLGGATTTPWAVSAIDQPQLAAYSSATHHSDANSPPVTTIESTFEWTNGGYSPKAPPPMGQTNSPMP